MPKIISSADLRNNYTEVSNLCHEYKKPVFVTKNGKGDLVIMSIEKYEEMLNERDFIDFINQGLTEVYEGKATSFDDFMKEVNQIINK